MLEQILADLSHLNDPRTLSVLMQVLVIDAALAGENAIVVGSLAAGLPPQRRAKVVAVGVLGALLMRVVFALIATELLQIVGLVFAGGLLLLWVAWKMWREMRRASHRAAAQGGGAAGEKSHAPAKSFAAVAWAVALADLSMSVDNVLGVAGAAKDHPGILIIGLAVSVALTGIAANVIARYIDRYRWIAWVGIAVVVWVACTMIWTGLTNEHVGLLQFF